MKKAIYWHNQIQSIQYSRFS